MNMQDLRDRIIAAGLPLIERYREERNRESEREGFGRVIALLYYGDKSVKQLESSIEEARHADGSFDPYDRGARAGLDFFKRQSI